MRKAGDLFVLRTVESFVWLIGVVSVIAVIVDVFHREFLNAIYDTAALLVVVMVVFPSLNRMKEAVKNRYE